MTLFLVMGSAPVSTLVDITCRFTAAMVGVQFWVVSKRIQTRGPRCYIGFLVTLVNGGEHSTLDAG